MPLISINERLWWFLCALSILSGPVMFMTMWITAPLTRTSHHGLYGIVFYIQIAIYIFTIATSKKWSVAVALLLAAPLVAISLFVVLNYAVCSFFGEAYGFNECYLR